MDVVNTWDQPWRVKFEREMFAAKRKPGCATINNHQATQYLWIWQDVTTVQCWFVLEVKLWIWLSLQATGNCGGSEWEVWNYQHLWAQWHFHLWFAHIRAFKILALQYMQYGKIAFKVWKILKKNIISSSFQYGGMKETHWIRKWKCDFHAKTKKKLFWSPHCNLTLLYI